MWTDPTKWIAELVVSCWVIWRPKKIVLPRLTPLVAGERSALCGNRSGAEAGTQSNAGIGGLVSFC